VVDTGYGFVSTFAASYTYLSSERYYNNYKNIIMKIKGKEEKTREAKK